MIELVKDNYKYLHTPLCVSGTKIPLKYFGGVCNHDNVRHEVLELSASITSKRYDCLVCSHCGRILIARDKITNKIEDVDAYENEVSK